MKPKKIKYKGKIIGEVYTTSYKDKHGHCIEYGWYQSFDDLGYTGANTESEAKAYLIEAFEEFRADIDREIRVLEKEIKRLKKWR